MNLQSRMEAEKQALTESLNSMEKRLNEEKSKNFRDDFLKFPEIWFNWSLRKTIK